MQRFDEVELQAVPLIEDAPPAPDTYASSHASRFHRLLALLTDLSLFVALTLSLSPLLPSSNDGAAVAALGGFVLMTSFYYFVGTWLLWGKTVGGTIFDVRVVPRGGSSMSFKAAALRWAGVLVSLLLGGTGFLLAGLPSRLSLADRLSRTHCIAA
jgi:uncharacterized RDD family membrane protein YckC